MLLSIVIPCLNEEKTITRAVKQAQTSLKKLGIRSSEIIVADNGSTDLSLQKIKTQGIARIVTVPIKGYGAAVHWGILKAKGTYILYADADLSYHFSDLKHFLPLLKRRLSYDLILGSRFTGTIKPQAMPFLHRYLGTPVLTFLIRFIYQIPTTDCNSGMRVVNKKFYQKLNMNNSGMEWASELLIRTALKRGKYTEVPITLHPDKRMRPPHLTAWADGWRHFKAIVLLKPDLLFIITGILFLMSGVSTWFMSATSVYFFLSGITMLFCTLAAKLIKFAIDSEKSSLSLIIMKLPLVKCAFTLFVVSFLSFIVYANEFHTQKLILLCVVLIFTIWVFFIETIKTHLLNKLPSSIKNFKY